MPELELVVLTKNVSSWSLRAWLPLVHHGIPFRERLIRGHDADDLAALRALSPTGKVPLLLHGGLVVPESLAILEYLAELFPEKRLWPEDRATRARARAVASEMHAGFAELRRRLPMNLARRRAIGPLEPAVQRDVDRFCAFVQKARAEAPEGPFLFGAFGNADAMLAPVATRFRSYGVEVDPITQAWCDAVLALPAMRRWEAEAAGPAATEPMIEGPGRVLDVVAADHEPAPPCYAVVFTNQQTGDVDDYGPMSERMVALARTQPGFVGYETTRSAQGLGITVSYWRSLEAIAGWRAHLAHRAAQELGRARFYEAYRLTVARVERESGFGSPEALAKLRLT